MDEQLDNDLNNRIREVFDNFDDTSYPSADEGWLLLRNKFPEMEKKRPVAWLWWGSTAAAVLLFIGFGLWMTSKKQQPETMAVKPAKNKQEQIVPADTNKLLATKQNPALKNNPANAATAPAIDTVNKYASKTPVNKLPATPSVPNITVNKAPDYANTNIAAVQQPLNNTQTVNNTKLKTKPEDSVKSVVAKTNAPQYAITAPAAPGTNTVLVAPIKIKPDSAKTITAKTNTPQYAVTAPAADANTGVPASSNTIMRQPVKVAPKQAPANSMDRLFAGENTKPQKTEEKDIDKKVRFGVYAATFVNYAKGSNNQINAGAGFTSDIKLTKNLKLSTGVALAQNTLSYNSAPPITADAVSKTQALASYRADLFSTATAFPVLKNYNASLIGLDIPMNIKYEFNPQKSDAYISAGLSSGTFINEAYTSVYGFAPSSIAAGAPQQTTDEVTRKNFSGFYFAKTLNVSFGVGYPVGKGNRLIIEPFLKYPLSGLGSQQIQFGAAGLNLKLNFTTQKK
jgi:hypothetical protein